MKKSISIIQTQAASSYIGKLCRHFRHKIEATYTPTTGRAIFPFGTCEMIAKPDQLVFDITASKAEDIEKIKGVLVRHLLKFSYKEELIIEWQDDMASSTD
ncbi:DUF2218 domain-containing protein [Parapedobacter sp. ISTM3]|uniref:DUF2218 domain-containing protein n=1 Tax=Parapedobacter sp. ISTM3 TaxID=2800130 RepID=UPI0019060BED|nr:DUF2218 domain-containing protein [Parapedobacter sp. ISTM3]MBK1440164.1 DUF2218 domain-containing protein [Parapedobacter sp. ISTM3]